MKDSFFNTCKELLFADYRSFIVITIRNHIYLPWSFSNIELVNISIKNII